MNVFASECSSGCESGWTVYLEHSNYLSHIPSASRSRDMNGKRKSDFCDIQVDEEPDDEEDQSMVSDASSGPPHFNENEVYFDENNNNNNNGCSYPPQISKDAENLKIAGKRKQGNNIKGKDRRSCGDQQQQQQQQQSFLDDTASSPVFNYSKNNFIVSNNQASGSSVLDYSQGFSSTHFQGRSAYQDLHFGFLQSSNPSGNNQWFQG